MKPSYGPASRSQCAPRLGLAERKVALLLPVSVKKVLLSVEGDNSQSLPTVQPDYQDSYNDEDGRKKSYGPNDTMRAQVTLKEAIKNARNRIKASEESDTRAGVSNTQ